MKLQYATPMQELKLLLQTAEATPGISILVNKAEMKALVTHAEALTMFPEYVNGQKAKHMRFDQQLNEIRQRSASPTITQEALQSLWDSQSRIERQKRQSQDEVPSTIKTLNGITIQVALNV